METPYLERIAKSKAFVAFDGKRNTGDLHVMSGLDETMDRERFDFMLVPQVWKELDFVSHFN